MSQVHFIKKESKQERKKERKKFFLVHFQNFQVLLKFQFRTIYDSDVEGDLIIF